MRIGSLIYLELRHDGFTGRNLSRANVRVATEDDRTIFPPADIQAAFGHERLIVADLVRAEYLLATMIRKLVNRAVFAPIVIIRVQHRFADSATPVELMALLTLIERAGARSGYLWLGRELADEEILHRQFPSEGISFCRRDFARFFKKTRS